MDDRADGLVHQRVVTVENLLEQVHPGVGNQLGRIRLRREAPGLSGRMRGRGRLRRRQLVGQRAQDDIGVNADGLRVGAHERASVEPGRQALEVAFLDLAQEANPDPGPAADLGEAQPLRHSDASQLCNGHGPQTLLARGSYRSLRAGTLHCGQLRACRPPFPSSSPPPAPWPTPPAGWVRSTTSRRFLHRSLRMRCLSQSPICPAQCRKDGWASAARRFVKHGTCRRRTPPR